MEETILIVDDDVNLCHALSEELTEVGYRAHWVTNGDDAIDYVLNKPVDIMLLDLKMPVKDGFEVLKEIEKYKLNLKIIVLTAYADVRSAVAAAKLGATDFINKPYDFDELLITIHRVLQASSE